jgi:hypothetical protein
VRSKLHRSYLPACPITLSREEAMSAHDSRRVTSVSALLGGSGGTVPLLGRFATIGYLVTAQIHSARATYRSVRSASEKSLAKDLDALFR